MMRADVGTSLFQPHLTTVTAVTGEPANIATTRTERGWHSNARAPPGPQCPKLPSGSYGLSSARVTLGMSRDDPELGPTNHLCTTVILHTCVTMPYCYWKISIGRY